MSAIDEKAPLLTASPHDDAREGETLALAVNQEGGLPGGEEEVTRYENKPWKYKALALLCSCLISIGSHFAAQMLGALKSTLRDEISSSNPKCLKCSVFIVLGSKVAHCSQRALLGSHIFFEEQLVYCIQP